MGDTDSFQPVILLTVTARQSEDFVSCEARILWYSTDTTSSRKLRDTTDYSTVPRKLFLLSITGGNDASQAHGQKESDPLSRKSHCLRLRWVGQQSKLEW